MAPKTDFKKENKPFPFSKLSKKDQELILDYIAESENYILNQNEWVEKIKNPVQVNVSSVYEVSKNGVMSIRFSPDDAGKEVKIFIKK